MRSKYSFLWEVALVLVCVCAVIASTIVIYEAIRPIEIMKIVEVIERPALIETTIASNPVDFGEVLEKIKLHLWEARKELYRVDTLIKELDG